MRTLLRETDNRTPEDIIRWYEARIDALQRCVVTLTNRVAELETATLPVAGILDDDDYGGDGPASQEMPNSR